jgi:hypothetical protein
MFTWHKALQGMDGREVFLIFDNLKNSSQCGELLVVLNYCGRLELMTQPEILKARSERGNFFVNLSLKPTINLISVPIVWNLVFFFFYKYTFESLQYQPSW